MSRCDIAAVIPVYNPEPALIDLCAELLKSFSLVLVVDDGSNEHVEDFSKLPDGVCLLRHVVNRGKGRAIKTALEWLKENAPSAKGAVFVDGDGQHRPEDVILVASRMLDTGRVTMGVRDFSKSGIPFRSRFGNVLTSFLVRLLFRVKIYDTQTGLRAIPVRMFDVMSATAGERYEYEMRIFGVLRDNGEALEQVPIRTVYIENNRRSHFRPIVDSIKIYKGLFGMTIARFLKFVMSSLLGFVADNAVFTALLFALKGFGFLRRYDILISLIVARVFSGTLNYLCNRAVVFKSATSAVKSFTRYWVLVLLVAILSYAGTAGVSALVDAQGWGITGIKVVIESVTFILSFELQKRWVFGR